MPTAFPAAAVEQRTQDLGREMFAHVRASAASPLAFEWWQEQMLQQFMKYEWLKIQAFRFIHALPNLTDDAEVARHMREYFVHPHYQKNGRANGHAHSHGHDDQAVALRELADKDGTEWVYRLVSQMMDLRSLRSPYAKFFVNLSRWSARIMAGSFIAGSNIDEAVAIINKQRQQSLPFTIDVLGESAVSKSEADKYWQTYDNLIDELPRRAKAWTAKPLVDLADGVAIPSVNVSVKLTSLYPGFDPIAPEAAKARAKELLRPLLRKAMAGGAHLHVDMEHYAIKDLTLDVFEELILEDEFRDYPHFGIVLQAYLKDGDRDIDRLVAYAKKRGTPIWIRLVKGAYWDSETVWAQQRSWPCPVWPQKWQSDACYERMSRVMLENHEHIHSAFASHNIRSLCYALALKEALDVPAHKFEWQMLYGMGDPLKRAAVKMGQRCRVYTPYGDMMAGMAYLIRRLLENTANESFLRNSADESAEAELLENPEDTGARTSPEEIPQAIRYEFEEPIMEPFENAPNTDFALEENRQRMLTALSDVRAELGATIPLQIGGQPVQTTDTFDSINPSRPSEIIGRVCQPNEEQIDAAVDAAKDAFGVWKRFPVADRARVVRRAGEILAQRRFELAALECFEVGKPWREADADISEAIDYCNFYAAEMERISDNPRRRDVPGEINEYTYAPRGVTAVISPFNFPIALTAGMLAGALVTGNTVVLKPASPAAALGSKLAEIFAEAGLPPGAINFLPGPGAAVGEALAVHPDVYTIAFTGSRGVGCHINRLAAGVNTSEPGLKRVNADMGGKNAIIIDSDADLGDALKGVLGSALSFAGQKCTACSRVIVVGTLYERFMERLVDAAASKGCGPADEPTTAIPPLIDQDAFDTVRQYIESGKQAGKCVLETDVSDLIEKSGGGYFVGPTIFTDMPADAPLAREEIFGPVLIVHHVPDIDAAIALFNDCDYALTGGIYSRSPANIEKARTECQCGNFYINRVITGSKVDLQPFGGHKMSGTGSKAGGPDYLMQFCQARTVTENTLRGGFAPNAPSEEIHDAIG